jgi:quinol monooxygenase YgiN
MYDTGTVKPPFPQYFETFPSAVLRGGYVWTTRRRAHAKGREMSDDVELAVLTAVFDARGGAEEQLAGALARYVVLARSEDGCRNVDLVISTTHSGRFTVIAKWDSPEAARAHLDGPAMADMAREAVPLLGARPDIDLHDAISAHDLT